MKSKKTQIQHAFMYIATLIIIGLVVYFGFKSIVNLGNKKQEAEFLSFKNQLDSDVYSLRTEYGSFRELRYRTNIKLLCVLDQTAGHTEINETLPEVIKDLAKEETTAENVVLVTDDESLDTFNVNGLGIKGNSKVKCFRNKEGIITIKAYGAGKRVLV